MNLYNKKEIYINADMVESQQVIHTSKGDVIAQIGDYVIVEADGEKYPMQHDEFIKYYELVDGNLYKSKSIKVWATRIPKEIKLKLESGLTTSEGDYIIIPFDSNEIYYCKSQIFENMYTLISNDVETEKIQVSTFTNNDFSDEKINDVDEPSIDEFIDESLNYEENEFWTDKSDTLEVDDYPMDNTDERASQNLDIDPLFGTLVRTIALFVVSVISVLNGLGLISYSDTSNEAIYNLIISLITVVISINCWWKNNSFTKAAKTADKIMRELKNNNNSTANG